MRFFVIFLFFLTTVMQAQELVFSNFQLEGNLGYLHLEKIDRDTGGINEARYFQKMTSDFLAPRVRAFLQVNKLLFEANLSVPLSLSGNFDSWKKDWSRPSVSFNEDIVYSEILASNFDNQFSFISDLRASYQLSFREFGIDLPGNFLAGLRLSYSFYKFELRNIEGADYANFSSINIKTKNATTHFFRPQIILGYNYQIPASPFEGNSVIGISPLSFYASEWLSPADPISSFLALNIFIQTEISYSLTELFSLIAHFSFDTMVGAEGLRKGDSSDFKNFTNLGELNFGFGFRMNFTNLL